MYSQYVRGCRQRDAEMDIAAPTGMVLRRLGRASRRLPERRRSADEPEPCPAAGVLERPSEDEGPVEERVDEDKGEVVPHGGARHALRLEVEPPAVQPRRGRKKA